MIFAVTGHTETIFTEKALDSGMNIVLFKPVNANQLNALLDKIGFPSGSKKCITSKSDLDEPPEKKDESEEEVKSDLEETERYN